MKKIVLSIGLPGLLMCSCFAFAGQTVNESRPASSSSFIDIEHVNGKAEIIGWDKDEVKVVGELGDRTEEFTFRERDGDIRIKVEVESQGYGNWKNWDKGEGDDLVIHVPFGASVNYESINGELSLEGLTGKTEAEVINGNIDANNLSGRIQISSVNGGIDLQNVEGDLSIETVNGGIQGKHLGENDVTVDSVNGSIELISQSKEVRAETVNGDIELQLDEVTELEISTVNGDIEVEMTLLDGGDVEGSTVGGRIDLKFQESVSARFDIEAHAGGRISNGLTKDKMQKAKYGPRRWLNFSTGTGASQVELSTVSGRITVDSK